MLTDTNNALIQGRRRHVRDKKDPGKERERGKVRHIRVHVHEEERKAKERKGHQETKIYKNRSQGTQKEQRNAVHDVSTNNRYIYWEREFTIN